MGDLHPLAALMASVSSPAGITSYPTAVNTVLTRCRNAPFSSAINMVCIISSHGPITTRSLKVNPPAAGAYTKHTPLWRMKRGELARIMRPRKPGVKRHPGANGCYRPHLMGCKLPRILQFPMLAVPCRPRMSAGAFGKRIRSPPAKPRGPPDGCDPPPPGFRRAVPWRWRAAPTLLIGW